MEIPITNQMQRVWLFNLVLVLMVTFSPLLWYHHTVFLLLPYAVLLFASPGPYRLMGLIALGLVQSQRSFEFAIFDFPWPGVTANLIVLLVTLFGFARVRRDIIATPD